VKRVEGRTLDRDSLYPDNRDTLVRSTNIGATWFLILLKMLLVVPCAEVRSLACGHGYLRSVPACRAIVKPG